MTKRGLAAFLSPLFFCIFLSGATGAPALAAGSGDLLTALKNLPAQTDKLRSMMADLTENQFQIVDVQSVLSPGDEATFKSAVKKNAPDIADLRDTLSHTTLTGNDGVIMPVSKLLLAKLVKIEQVVAIYVAGNQITIYYQ